MSWGSRARAQYNIGKHAKDPRPEPLSDDEIERMLRRGLKGEAIKHVPKGTLRRIQAKIARSGGKHAKGKDGKK